MDHYLKKELYELLKNDEGIFDFIQEGSLDGLWYWDLEKPENEWMNARFWEVLGYNSEKMPHLASAWQDIINQDDLQLALDNFNKHVKDPEYPYDQIVRYKHKKGSTVWVRCRGLAIRDKNGKPIRMLGAHQDITALKQTEIQLQTEKDLLRKSEEKYKNIFENAPLAIQSLDIDGNIIDVNPKWLKILGYSSHEVLGKWFGDFLHEDYVQQLKTNFPILKNQGYINDVQFEMLRKNGESIYVSLEGSVGLDKNGDFKQTYCTLKDITTEKEAENKLIASEARYKQLIDTASDAIYLINEEGTIIDTNQGATQLLQKTKNEIIGSTIDILEPSSSVEEFIDFWKDIPINEPRIVETRHINNHGDEIPVEVSAKKFIIDKQNYYFGIARNITERKASENELIKQRDLFELVIDSIPTRVFWKDLNSVYLGCNQHFIKDSGMKCPEDIIGKNDHALVWKKDAEKYRNDDKLVMSSGKPKGNYEEAFINAEGKKIWWRTNKKPLRNSEGEIIGLIATSENITEEKKSADELKESEEKFRGIFQYANIGISLTDPTGQQLDINDEFARKLGYSKEACLSMNFSDLSHPDDTKKEFLLLKSITDGKTDNYVIEKRLRKKNGAYLWFDVSITARRNATGEVDMYIAMASDITERKKALEKEEKEHSYIQMILDNFPIGIAINDLLSMKATYMNRKFSELYGWPENEIPTFEHFFEKVFPDIEYRKEQEARIREDIESGDLERMNWDNLKITTKNGDQRIIFAANIPFPEQNIMISTIQDVTDRKKAEFQVIEAKSKLEEINLRYNMAIEAASDGIFDWNLISNEIYYSPRWKKILGYEDSELPNVFSIWEKLTKKEDVKKSQEMLNLLIEGKRDKFELEFKMRHKDGHWVDILSRANVFHNEKNKAYRIVGTHFDISERKKHEKELIRAKENAEESDRLKTEFLHNMSHEIRTPMNGIMGFSGLFSKSGINSEKRAYYASIVQNSSKQLLRIIDDILEISTLETKQLKLYEEEFSLNGFIMELFSIFNLKSKERKIPLYVKKALLDEQSYIVTDKAKLRKILDNLLENALKFTSEGYIELGYYFKSSHLVIYVKDTGIGISKQNKKLIFERFSQGDKKTANKHGGLGLGLSISKENAQLLDGDITLESEEGKGSTFFVTIPYKPLKNKNAAAKEEKKIYTILIAEDEEVNFLYLEAILQNMNNMGLKLIHAKNGREALDICLSDEIIHLVLMDIKMPVMNGYEASKKIRAELPDLPIIAQTAYSTEADKKNALKHGCNHHLSKPIDTEKLFEIIARYLKEE